jgi:hypothetical protein
VKPIFAALQGPDSITTRRAFRLTLIQQIPIALLFALMLDGGRTARICGVAMVGYWVVVAWILVRRPVLSSRTDLVFVRWGFLALFFASLALAASWKR